MTPEARNIMIGGGATIGLLALLAIVLRVSRDPVARSFTTIASGRAEMKRLASKGLVEILEDGDRMTIGNVIAGVKFNYEDLGNSRGSKINNLDPRFGVFLVHLAQFLRSKGVTDVIDGGITHGGGDANDCHNQGRAIDLVGFKGPDIDLNIQKNWGDKTRRGDGAYRLSPSDPGYELFREIYQFAAEEVADRSCDATPRVETIPTQIGEASCIVTPDHPSASLRATHSNHFHIQLGRTYGVMP